MNSAEFKRYVIAVSFVLASFVIYQKTDLRLAFLATNNATEFPSTHYNLLFLDIKILKTLYCARAIFL